MENLVAIWGTGLLVANVLFDNTFEATRQNIIGGSFSSSDINTSPVHFILFGILTLFLLTFLAGSSPKAAKACLAALAAFTILWLMNYKKNPNPTPAPVTP